MLKIGSEVKPFSADAFQAGKDFFKVTNKDILGHWSIFFFYPADFTFVCPTELEDMANLYPEFKKLGVEIYSVSTDKHFSHKAWHDSSEKIKKINYIMIGDPSGEISSDFGVLRSNMHAADRATFLVDPEGKVQYIEITSEGVGREADNLLGKVKAAQYVAKHPGEVCPAKWKEGEKTLKPSLDLVGKL